MSAKKAASSPARKPATRPSRRSSANGRAAKPSATHPVAASQRTLSDRDIGEVAGEIWQLLSASDGRTLAAIKKSVGAPADVVVAAVGWLAREGKLAFITHGRTVKLALKR